MTLPLTPETLRAAYDYLVTTPPFCRWRLPPSDEIQFRVAKDRGLAGWHVCWGRGRKRKQRIAISSHCVGYTQSIMGAVAHEVLHMYLDLSGQGKGGEHNAAFHLYAKRICKYHGFDPKGF